MQVGYLVILQHKLIDNSNKHGIMAKTGKTVATLLIGAAIGAAVGYLLATDKEKRQKDMAKIKDRFSNLKDKLAKKTEDFEHEIYNS